MIYNDIKNILPMFRFEGRFLKVEEINSGNINVTYHLTYRRRDGGINEYTLQHINGYVFKEPDVVMRNIDLVTRHLKNKYLADSVDPSRRTLEIVPTRTGEIMYHSNHCGFWRAYYYIGNATAYDRIEENQHFYEVGRAFGKFQQYLCDFPVAELSETIPNFHNTPKRFYAMVAAVDRDSANRACEVEEELEFFFERRIMMSEIVKMLAAGALPMRVTHNDTKINNVMIDNDTGEAVCVIDLDTVMPGSVLYDYGDAIRTGASTADEDEEDLSKIELDMDRFTLFTEGFLKETNGFLSPNELRLLPLGIKVITCELAMRFLTDYIDGDKYFKVKSPEHNLIRARAQMKLLTDIEDKYETLTKSIEKLI